MWNLGKTVIKNLLTHVHTEHQFDSSSCFMVSGINLDDPGASSNGSGKSTLEEGVLLAITGDSFRKVSSTELVRNGEDFLEVEQELIHSITKDILVTWRRVYSSSKSSLLRVTLNGEIPKELPESTSPGCVDVRKGNKYILDTIGISKEDLLNYYALSKETYESFLLSGDAAKKKVIDRFSNSQIVDPVFTLVDKDIADSDKIIQDTLTKKNSIESSIETIQYQIDNYTETSKSEIIEGYEKEISEDEVKIEKFKQIVVQTEKNLPDFEDKLKKSEEKGIAKKKRAAALEISIQEIEDSAKKYDEEALKLRTTVGTVRKTLEELNSIKSDFYKKVQDSITCPECSHEFNLQDKEADISELRKLLLDIEKDISEVTQEIVDLQSDVSKVENKATEVRSDKKKFNQEVESINQELRILRIEYMNFQSELSEEKTKISNSQSQINTLQKRVETLKEKIVSESQSKETNMLESMKSQIIGKKDELSETLKKLKIEETKKSDLVEQKEIFKKFKTYLAGLTVTTIEGYTNHYLKNIHTNLQVKLSAYREKADGTYREEISASVLRDGVDEGNLKKFSGGEKAKVDICNILALQKIINTNSPTGGLNLCFLDEIVESIDYEGVTEIYQALNQLNQCIQIISHVRDTGFENQLFIKKQNKVSTITNREDYVNLLTLNN